MSAKIISDMHQRQLALNCQQSFIVQAPAGSGKTELLTQRYLKLLSQAEKAPEEIIAITFTKKAAAEMHSRIVHALQRAQINTTHTQEPEKTTQQLALAVLQRNQEMQWGLMENPNRLRIQTIDSLCTYIAHQLPILSQFGAAPQIVENASEYYNLAAEQCLNQLEDPSSNYANDVAQVLYYCDNNYVKLQRLLTDMLKTRDQWLPHLTPMAMQHPEQLQAMLSQSLINIVKDLCQALQAAFPKKILQELLPLLQFAQQQLVNSNSEHPLAQGTTIITLPAFTVENVKTWLAISELFLTKDFTWRKSLNVKQGFPPKTHAKDKQTQQLYVEMKQQMQSLLNDLANNPELTENFIEFMQSPPIEYHDEQWKTLLALINLLPILAAQLTLVFRDYGVVDFIEVTQAALRALGDEDAPSDAALNLDYQIRHILFDEFQDTSLTQFQLLKKLTAGWQSNDGRTLFLVGDPMQSIYRFRQAEVGLFLQAQNDGINDIYLQPLTLTHNFRSCQTIVDWINRVFSEVFPKENHIDKGAIRYTAATANKTDHVYSQIKFHPIINAEDNQAKVVISIINTLLTENNEQSIAILVRSRGHLLDIIEALQQQKIPYQAVEIEPLMQQPLIQDLFALTRALDHLGDRIAWLALLRAPWCGLKLNDLHAIANAATDSTIWQSLQNYLSIASLSQDALQRLSIIVLILQQTFNQQTEKPFARWVELTWIALAGHALLDNMNDNDNATIYFQCLQKLTLGEKPFVAAKMQEKLTQLYATTHSSHTNPIQIMTIHKAKGLEFDTVIIPCLEKNNRNDDNELLAYDQRLRDNSSTVDMILAPIHATAASKEPIYQYLQRRQHQKQAYELQRLLYVAITRAKHQLHLLTHIEFDEITETIQPSKNKSFLSQLWPFLPKSQRVLPPSPPSDDKKLFPYHPLKRCSVNWLKQFHSTHPVPASISGHNDNMQLLSPDQNAAMAIGTVIHRYLQHIAEQGVKLWPARRVAQLTDAIQHGLAMLGVKPTAIMEAKNIVLQALINTLNDSTGQWILAEHLDAHCEYTLHYKNKDRYSQLVLDRTFIDNNTRWIIDYKTADPAGQRLETFMRNQAQLYQSQLTSYASAMAALTEHPIRLGLYFPLIQGWYTWSFS